MAEPTTSRATLRRQICRDLQMPFFRRFSDGYLTVQASTSGTTDELRDDRLTQAHRFWKGAWFYDVSASAQRLIIDFQQDRDAMLWEFPLDNAPTAASDFEILSTWNPKEVHDAIDEAIREAFPAFYDVVISEDIVLETDKLEYDLATSVGGRGVLTNAYRIKAIWLEQTGSGATYTAASGAGTAIAVDDETFTGTDTDWAISVYDGAGAGQLRGIESGDSDGNITIDTALSVSLDTTSKLRIWDKAGQLYPWRAISAVRFDQKVWPNKLYFNQRYESQVGLRMRIQYIAQPQSLESDSAETMVPQKYIQHYAMGKLFGVRIPDNAVDRKAFATLEDRMMQKAAEYKINNAFNQPDGTLWTEEEHGPTLFSLDDDPLGWRD